MAGSIDISLSDLMGKFPAQVVSGVFSDDGSGQPGHRLFESISEGRRIADAILLAAWSQEQIETLVQEDAAIRSAVLKLVLAAGMEGRPEWDSEGGYRDRLFKSATTTLDLLVKAQLRSVGEREAGENPHASVGRVTHARDPHSFMFASTRGVPRRGGF
jgi:hypothetical protein